ncbi:MAG: 50S ribosomal protein L4 [Candidatus Aenigmatarchaeota archaeon]
MEVNVLNLKGEPIEKIKLDEKIFNFPIREDLVLRAVLAFQANRRQKYGADPFAGLRTSAEYHGRRRVRPYVTQMGIGRARHQRIHGKAPPHMIFVARISSNVRKGMRAHSPTSQKEWKQKINKKEKKIAMLSAAVATLIKEYVFSRYEIKNGIKYFPIVISGNELEKVKKAKEFKEFLKSIGLEEILDRIQEKKKRAGKGKMRGRKYKKHAGILLVVSDKERAKNLAKVLKNLNIHVRDLKNLNAEILAPGAKLGRLTIWEKEALIELSKSI